MTRRDDRFRDRADAGRHLADELAGRGFPAPHVFALPRGGVPVASEVADVLEAPLDVVVARKVGMPGDPEFAIGAVAEGGAPAALRADAASMVGADRLERAVADARAELDRRVQRYRAGRPLPRLDGRTAVLVDDGLATGATAEAAIGALRARSPRQVVLAVPVGAADTVARLRSIATVICLRSPSPFRAVGRWYVDFDQTSDQEVVDLLGRTRH